MWLIVGLGNPGREYQFTRHNVGFRVIDRLSSELGIPLTHKGFLAKWGRGLWENEKVLLAKPQTYMNLSGESVIRLVDYFQIGTEKVIVIHDDLDLAVGQIRIKEKGGDGGHKGVRSIMQHLGRGEFIRVRLGISRPDSKGEGINYVLSNFDGEQNQTVRRQLEAAEEAVKVLLREGIARAMNRFNQRKDILGPI